MDLEIIIIILTKHINLDAHLHQKEKITQKDHCLKEEPLHHCPLIILLLLALTGLMDILIVAIQKISTLPMGTTPMDTILMDIIPMDTTPMGTTPMDIILMDTTPMTMISLIMDPVTHPPIAKNLKNIITMAMAHHMTTQEKGVQVKGMFVSSGVAMAQNTAIQEKEVQVKNTFLSISNKLDMFTGSLH